MVPLLLYQILCKAYNLYHDLEGHLPWFCETCVATLKSQHSITSSLSQENSALRMEVSQLRSMIPLMHDLSAKVDKLSNTLESLTLHDNTPSPSPSPNMIVDTSDNMGTEASDNPGSSSLSPPGIHSPYTHTSPSLVTSRIHSPHAFPPIPTNLGLYYIRATPLSTSFNQVQNTLQELDIPHTFLFEPNLKHSSSIKGGNMSSFISPSMMPTGLLEP